jgi:zinc-finger of transposase IS204/IS1001/IS1096/IS1165
MQQALRPSALVPLGFVVENVACDGATTVITVRRASRSSPCPGCGTSSERIHSRYLRRVADLPLAGRPVRLVVVARRFRCGADLCGRRIFTERFEDGVLAPWRGALAGSNMSSITSGLLSAAARQRVSLGD